MIKGFNRQQHVAKEIQKKIAIILQYRIQDPRINTMVTVSDIKISKDLAYAKIYVTFLNSENESTNIKILQKASSYIRTLLSRAIHLRVVPELTFFYDNSLVNGIKIYNLVNDLTKHYRNSTI